MLVVVLLLVILVVLIEQGRWRYFEAHRLPDGFRLNYRKYGGFAVAAILFAVMFRASWFNVVLIWILVYGLGPYLEHQWRCMAARSPEAQGVSDEDVETPPRTSLLRGWWKSGGVPPEPPDEDG